MRLVFLERSSVKFVLERLIKRLSANFHLKCLYLKCFLYSGDLMKDCGWDKLAKRANKMKEVDTKNPKVEMGQICESQAGLAVPLVEVCGVNFRAERFQKTWQETA